MNRRQDWSRKWDPVRLTVEHDEFYKEHIQGKLNIKETLDLRHPDLRLFPYAEDRTVLERYQQELDTLFSCMGIASMHRCSSATTLIMNGLEFGGQELSKRPDMISQSSSHARSSVAPLGLDQS